LRYYNTQKSRAWLRNVGLQLSESEAQIAAEQKLLTGARFVKRVAPVAPANFALCRLGLRAAEATARRSRAAQKGAIEIAQSLDALPEDERAEARAAHRGRHEHESRGPHPTA